MKLGKQEAGEQPGSDPVVRDSPRLADVTNSGLAGRGLTDAIAAITKPATDLKEAIGVSSKQSDAIAKALSGVAGFGQNPALQEAFDRIDRQTKLIEKLDFGRASMDVSRSQIGPPSELEIAPNPIFETNKRLSDIEARFHEFLEVGRSAAGVATSLQQAAAEFLAKFEAAAADNDRSASKAIKLGWIAVIVAVGMPLAQIGVDWLESRRDSSRLIEDLIEEMRRTGESPKRLSYGDLPRSSVAGSSYSLSDDGRR